MTEAFLRLLNPTSATYWWKVEIHDSETLSQIGRLEVFSEPYQYGVMEEVYDELVWRLTKQKRKPSIYVCTQVMGCFETALMVAK